MARKPETIEGDAAEIEQRAIEALQTIGTEEFQLDSVLASLGDSDEKARVMLYRVGKSGEKDRYLRQFKPQEWLDYGQDGVLYDYGGGSYRVRVYDARSKLRANTALELEEPRTNRAPVPPYPARLAEAAPMHHPAPNPSADILAAVGAMAQAMQTAIAAAFDKMATVVQAQPKREDLLKEMVQFKTLFAPPPAAPVPIVTAPDSLETFMKAVSFVKENLSPNSGETGPADVFLEIAKQFAPVIAEQARVGAQITAQQASNPALRAAPHAAALAARAVHAGPAPATGEAAPTTTATEPTTEEQMNLQLSMALNFLIQQARNDSDPLTYADMVLDNVDPELLEQWRAQSPEALIEWLAGFNPEVRNHAAWFKQVHAAVVEELNAPEPPAAPSAADPLTSAANASTIGEPGEVED